MHPRHRIAFCITELDRGGAEGALTRLVTGLDRSFWEPRVICLGPEGHFTSVLLEAGIPVVTLGGRGPMSLPRVWYRLVREFKAFRPAIVQSFLFHANVLGTLAAARAGVPARLTGHRVSDRRSRWFGRVERWVDRWVTRRICVSQGVADYLHREFGFDPARTDVIPNTIRPSDWQVPAADLTQFGFGLNHTVLLTVGRLDRQKGTDILVNTASLLRTTHPDLRWLVVGPGDPVPWRNLAARTGVAELIHFAGPRDDVAALMNAAQALVLASRWEGMPNVVLEAMAAGCPVISTKVEGVVELIEPNRNGWVVAPENPAALASAVIGCLANPETARRYAAESQTIVSEKFTHERSLAKYDALYRQLLSSR